MVVEVLKTFFRDVNKRIKNDDGTTRAITYKQKVHTVKLTGTTPKVQAADGTTWRFIGVITPSAQGKALLKLAPSAGDSDALRKLHSANPYYCDYCKKIRQRNETFIVNNGNDYRQVGRNCLKDFVGGADPQSILRFFSFFSNIDELNSRLNGDEDDSGGGDGFGSGGRRGAQYFTPVDVLATTLAVLEVRGGYVSAKTEHGTSTANEVRTAYWGQMDRHTPKEEREAIERIRKLKDDPAMIEKANSIITWFKALPKSQIEGNSFFQNIAVMVDEDAVESKMIGYIVGLYPAWQRDQQQEAERTPGVRLTKDWPESWGRDPKPVSEEHAVVKFVRRIDGMYGPSQLISLMLDNGLGVTWKYSGRNGVTVGDEFKITGELQPDDYTTPPRVKFVPSRKWLRSAFVD